MREILFRGKRKSNGKWIEGYVFKQIVSLKDEYYIRRGDTDYLVIPETVGEYTGNNDKNGRKIFEGDIVKIDDEIAGIVKYTDEGFIIDSDEFFATDEDTTFEIIGNAYDNPELLKGE